MSILKAAKPLKPHARAIRFGLKSAVSLFGRYYPRDCTVCGHRGRFFLMAIHLRQWIYASKLAIDLPDECVDLVLCLHVLEHVDDDRRAMAEVHRILRPSGHFIVMVPIEEGWEVTYENPKVVSPRQRLLHFGQEDHVRFYGRDIRNRLTAAG